MAHVSDTPSKTSQSIIVTAVYELDTNLQYLKDGNRNELPTSGVMQLCLQLNVTYLNLIFFLFLAIDGEEPLQCILVYTAECFEK